MSNFNKAKIIKYLVEPLEIRFNPITPEAKRDAFIEDAISDMGNFEADVIDAAFTQVRRNHGQNYKPALKDFVSAAKSIAAARSRNNAGEDAVSRRSRVSGEAHKYAANFQWNEPQGVRLRERGVDQVKMRNWVFQEAARQIFDGGKPDVTIPDEVVETLVRRVSSGRQVCMPAVRKALDNAARA